MQEVFNIVKSNESANIFLGNVVENNYFMKDKYIESLFILTNRFYEIHSEHAYKCMHSVCINRVYLGYGDVLITFESITAEKLLGTPIACTFFFFTTKFPQTKRISQGVLIKIFQCKFFF